MLSSMNTSKPASIIFFVIPIVLLVGACGTLTPDTKNNSTPTISLTDANSTALSEVPTEVAQTMATIPTSTAVPTETVLAATPTRTPLPFMALDGLRVIYTDINGNLYVQDSGKPSLHLTDNVKESTGSHPPLVSDDGQKIIFYRAGEAELDSVYSINADGTEELLLVDPKMLSVFGQEYDTSTSLESLAFVPGTHLLLFNTFQPMNSDPDLSGWMTYIAYKGNDLFIVDTDTAKVKQLKTSNQGGNFLAAPNGKWVAVQTPDHIDIIDVQGRIIQGNLVVYSKAASHIVVPMAWTQDSRELIVLPSEIPLDAGVPAVRTIWRYPLDGSPGIEIKLTPAPVYDYYAVSPDGNWIVYSYDMGNLDPETTSGVYLGNLHDGTSQLLYAPQPNENTGFADVPLDYEGWNPDSTHFIFSDENFRMFIGNIHKEITPVGRGTGILGWIDTNRYLMENGALGEIGKQSLFIVVENYIDSFAFLEQ